jgi:hypothetical protein
MLDNEDAKNTARVTSVFYHRAQQHR